MTGIFPQIEVRVALMSGCSGSTVIVRRDGSGYSVVIG